MAKKFKVIDSAGKKFAVACDEFIVCDSTSTVRLCCPCTSPTISYEYYLAVPCGDVQFVVGDDAFTDNGCDKCDETAAGGVSQTWDVAQTAACTWFERDDDVITCGSGDTLHVRRDFSVRCCEDAGTVYVILEAIIWLIGDAVQDRHVFVKQIATITDQAGCTFLDYSNLDETLDYKAPASPHVCQSANSLTPIHCDPPATLRVRKKP